MNPHASLQVLYVQNNSIRKWTNCTKCAQYDLSCAGVVHRDLRRIPANHKGHARGRWFWKQKNSHSINCKHKCSTILGRKALRVGALLVKRDFIHRRPLKVMPSSGKRVFFHVQEKRPIQAEMDIHFKKMEARENEPGKKGKQAPPHNLCTLWSQSCYK